MNILSGSTTVIKFLSYFEAIHWYVEMLKVIGADSGILVSISVALSSLFCYKGLYDLFYTFYLVLKL